MCFMVIVCLEVWSNLESAYNYWAWDIIQQIFACSKPIIEILQKGLTYTQSQ